MALTTHAPCSRPVALTAGAITPSGSWEMGLALGPTPAALLRARLVAAQVLSLSVESQTPRRSPPQMEARPACCSQRVALTAGATMNSGSWETGRSLALTPAALLGAAQRPCR